MIIKEIDAKNVITKSNLPVCDFSVNLYTGCEHACKYCYACFISPIFPCITDVKAIIEQAKNQCNLIWLENLNLRGNYKAVILDYIKEKYPVLLPLYQEIYCRGRRSYWETLDTELKAYAARIGLDYVTNDDSMSRPFDAPPVIVNYFYHSEIKKSARKNSGKA